MHFSTPKFWYKKRGLLAYALLPVAWIYQAVHKAVQMVNARNIYEASVPVLCIGNAVAGGGGKTPTVIALLQQLKNNNIAANPFIISRGYGAQDTRSKIVDLDRNTAQDVGDEPLILAQYGQVIVGTDRKSSIEIAIENGADLILMDDGFFNMSIHHDVKILVVDRNMDFGNGLTIPAGPMREPLKSVLPKSNAIITIGPKFQSDLPVFETQLAIRNADHTKGDYIAFCGIGFPEKFHATLRKENFTVVGFKEFPDHYAYKDSDIQKMLEEAKSHNARLITTEKDFVKIPAKYKERMDVLYIDLHFTNDEAALVAFLRKEIRR